MEIGKQTSFIRKDRKQVWVNFSYAPRYVCFNFDEEGALRIRLARPEAFDVYDERWR